MVYLGKQVDPKKRVIFLSETGLGLQLRESGVTVAEQPRSSRRLAKSAGGSPLVLLGDLAAPKGKK